MRGGEEQSETSPFFSWPVMIAFLRLTLILFVVLTVLYLAVSIYARSLARERLEKRWDQGRGKGSRAHFIRLGLRQYQQSARAKLLLGIYILPMAAVAIVIYVLNFT